MWARRRISLRWNSQCLCHTAASGPPTPSAADNEQQLPRAIKVHHLSSCRDCPNYERMDLHSTLTRAQTMEPSVMEPSLHLHQDTNNGILNLPWPRHDRGEQQHVNTPTFPIREAVCGHELEGPAKQRFSRGSNSNCIQIYSNRRIRVGGWGNACTQEGGIARSGPSLCHKASLKSSDLNLHRKTLPQNQKWTMIKYDKPRSRRVKSKELYPSVLCPPQHVTCMLRPPNGTCKRRHKTWVNSLEATDALLLSPTKSAMLTSPSPTGSIWAFLLP